MSSSRPEFLEGIQAKALVPNTVTERTAVSHDFLSLSLRSNNLPPRLPAG